MFFIRRRQMSSVKRNDNWGYLPDYSHQNHTLKFSRRARNADTYERADDRIPLSAWFGAAIVVAALFAVFVLGTAMGY
jgi:hypothetical protein